MRLLLKSCAKSCMYSLNGKFGCIDLRKHLFKAFEPCMDGAEGIVFEIIFRFFP